jgi:hypothetical protein
MKPLTAFGSLLLASFPFAACNGGNTRERAEPVSVTATALNAPGQSPIPYDWGVGKELWPANSTVPLLFLDAMVGCSTRRYEQGGFLPDQLALSDEYAMNVMKKAYGISCANSVPISEGNLANFFLWDELRSRPQCNRNASYYTMQAATITHTPVFPEVAMNTLLLPDDEIKAITYLARPSINLCIAQRLRAMSPGASGGEALLLSDAEQRELLAATLERAQRAMLGLSVLGLALMPDEPPDGYLQDIPLTALKAWAAEDANRSYVKALGTDLAAAIQLHTILATEYAEMLARSASAKLPRGGAPATDADTEWGLNSWRARTLSSLFGGYPLASESDNSSPWIEATGKEDVVRPWPYQIDSDYFPYAHTQIRQPEVHLFGSIANTLAQQTFTITFASTTACAKIDPIASGHAMYKELELALQRQTCDPSCVCSAESTCQPALPVNGSDDSQYRLFKRFGLRREHAITYAAFVGDHLDPICFSSQEQRYHQAAAANLTGTMAFDELAPSKVTILGTPGFAAKLIEQRVSEFTRTVPWRMPKQVWSTSRANEQGFLDPGTPETTRAYSNEGHIGTASALVAVREALHSMSRMKSDGVLATRIHDDFAAHSVKMLRLVGAAAGERSVTLRPNVFTQSILDLGMSQETDGEWHWSVDITNSDADSFWQGGAGVSIKVVPIPNEPWSGNLALYPQSRILGKTIDALVEPIVTKGAWPAGTAVDDTSESEHAAGLVHHTAAITLTKGPTKIYCPPCVGMWCGECSVQPSDMRFTLVARRVVGTGAPSYRLLASDLAPFVTDRQDGQYVGSGGRLGGIAERVLAAREHNPAQPKFDGFGLPTNWIPPSDPVLFGAQPGESAVAHYLDTAEAAANQATSAIDSAMNALLEQQQGEQDTWAAEKRAEELAKLEESSMCGDGNTSCEAGIQPAWAPILQWNGAWYKGTETQAATRHCPTGTELEKLKTLLPDGFPALPSPGDDGDATLEERINVVLKWCAGNELDEEHITECVQAYAEQTRSLIDPIISAAYGFRDSAAGLGEGNLNPVFTTQQVAAASVLYCQSLEVLEALAGDGSITPGKPGMVELAQVVRDHRDDALLPSFSEYAGGALQAALIEQWTALRLTRNLADEYVEAVRTAIARVLQAQSTMNASTNLYHDSCNPEKAREAHRACISFSMGFIPSFNAGPLIAYNQHCTELAAAVGPLVMAAHTAQAEATMQVASYASRFTSAGRDVLLSSANVSQLIQAARTAKTKNALEADLFKQTERTTSGLYRRFHSYDLWRAKALIESSRRYSALARRAVEAHYAVDLSLMKAPEPFVAAPSTWADEVYAYDLSLPAAVGLSVGEPVPGGIYSNKIADYVGNLRRFSQGFAVARPTATAHADTEIVTLAGPYATRTVKVKQNGIETGEMATLPAEDAMRWEVFCPNIGSAGRWRQVAYTALDSPSDPNLGSATPKWHDPPCECSLPETCSTAIAARPTRARVPFYLDPWGRLDDIVNNAAPSWKYNARWSKLAVNLVGTAVKDCMLAADPLTCYSQSFLRFQLRHVGPAWVSGYDQEWHLFAVPVGQVEGAKALAIEQFLDPLTNSWGKSYVDAAARTELADRPLGGAYQLEIDLGPEVVLKHIERVQLLLATNYWVEQQ